MHVNVLQGERSILLLIGILSIKVSDDDSSSDDDDIGAVDWRCVI